MLSPWLDLLNPPALTTGAITLCGVALLLVVPRFKWFIAAFLLIILTTLALAGFWPNGQWGISDWDYYFSYHEVVRRMTLNYSTVPTWNPYICGGTSAIGDPEFPFFTPTFLLELLFGVPVGIRLAAMAATAIGGLGMLALSYRLRLSAAAGLVAAIIFSFGSVTILELVEGHPNVFAVMYIPWILWAWHRAYLVKPASTWSVASSPRTILTGILLALMFFQGGIYLLMYLAGAFVFLIAVARRRREALLVTAFAGVWALGLAAIKLLPVLFWLAQFQDQAYASSANTLTSLHNIFLGRYLHGSEDVIPNQGGGWHEYGAYIGPFALALVFLGLTKIKQSRTVRLLALAAVIAIAVSLSGPLLKPLFDQAGWLPRSNISRVVLFAILPMSLLAGLGLKHLQAYAKKEMPKKISSVAGALVALLCLSIITVDLTSLTQALSQQAFVLTPNESTTRAAYPVEYTIGDYRTRYHGIDYTRAYAGILAGYGTQTYCSVLAAEPAVKTIQHRDENQSFLQTSDPEGSIELLSWKPNRIEVQTLVTQSADVIINANYAYGWKVNGEAARDVNNRLATNVSPGSHYLLFTYEAPGYGLGRLISGLFILLALLLLTLHYKKLQART